MDNITLVGAIASVTSLAIQIFNFFPPLGRVRGFLLAISVGFFVGSLTRTFEPTNLTFNIAFTFGTTVLSILCLLAIGFLFAGSFVPQSRNDFWGVALVLLGAFSLGCLFVFSPVTSKQRLTISELNYLAERAVDNGDINRAVGHLDEIEGRVRADKELHTLVLKRIQNLRRQELEKDSHLIPKEGNLYR